MTDKNEGLETRGKFAGRQSVFRGEDDEGKNTDHVIEVTDTEPEIELAWNSGKVRTYLRVRKSDLLRAIKEME